MNTGCFESVKKMDRCVNGSQKVYFLRAIILLMIILPRFDKSKGLKSFFHDKCIFISLLESKISLFSRKSKSTLFESHTKENQDK